SEGVPGRLVGIFEIANIGPQPGADAGADRRQDNIPVLLEIHTEPADQIGRAFDAAEALAIDVARGRGIIDQHQRARAVAAEIEADRGALPIDLLAGAILVIDHALAIAQAADKGAGAFLADDIGGGLALAGKYILNGFSNAP